jgi:hypothetical protein
METHLLAEEGVIKMAPSLFTSGVRPRHKVSKRNFNSGPDPRDKKRAESKQDAYGSMIIDARTPYYKYRSSTTRQSTICQSAER